VSRTSRLLLAPAAALALLALSPGTASADTSSTDPLGTVRQTAESLTGGPAGGLTGGLTGGLGGAGTPQQAIPAPAAGGTGPAAALPGALGGAADSLPGGLSGALPGGVPGLPGSGGQGGGTPGATGGGSTSAGTGDAPGGAAADEPAANPLAALCDQLRTGFGALSPRLAEGVDMLCEAAEADPTAAIRDLLEGLLAQLPTDPAAGCSALLGLIDQGAGALGVDAAPLRDLVVQLCALVPGEPAPAPAAQPQQPAAPVHPVVQPQQQAQPAVVPAASSGGTGGGRLAYTGVEPRPYLAAGVVALGLGAGLQRLGRRRA
jgi:hypothetical protein